MRTCPSRHFDDPDHLRIRVAHRHEVDHPDPAGRRLPFALEDQACRAGSAAGSPAPLRRGASSQRPWSFEPRIAPKHRAESKRGMHSQSIEPVAPDERRRLQIAEQRIVLDPLRHARNLLPTASAVLHLERERRAVASRPRGRTRAGTRPRPPPTRVAAKWSRSIGKQLGAGLEGVHVVAVQLLGLLAPRGVPEPEPLGDVGEDIGVIGARRARAAAGSHRRSGLRRKIIASSRYSSRCCAADASHVSSARARSAPARAAASASASPRSDETASVSASTSPAGTTRPAPNAAHRLAESRDVVDHHRQARAERLQQRARLVELGSVREDGDRRLRQRAVELGWGR